MNEKRIPYKAPLKLFLIALIIMICCTDMLVYQASTNNPGRLIIVLSKITSLNQILISWVFALVMGFTSLYFLKGMISLLSLNKKEMILTEYSLTAPEHLLSSRMVTVNYEDIKDIKIDTVYGRKQVDIYHVGGEIKFSEIVFPSKEVLDETIRFIESKRSPGMLK